MSRSTLSPSAMSSGPNGSRPKGSSTSLAARQLIPYPGRLPPSDVTVDDMKRSQYIPQMMAVCLLLLLAGIYGCMPREAMNLPPRESDIKKIEAGMPEKTVRLLIGDPDRTESPAGGVSILYYRGSVIADCANKPESCVPIVIERGKVSAIGHQWMQAWEKKRGIQPSGAPEGAARVPQAAGSGIDNRPLKLSGDADTAGQSPETRKEIARLEAQVRKIPVARTMDNLRIYRYLLKLDPGNSRYRDKVAFYETKAEEDRVRRVRMRQIETERRKIQNEILKSFVGNNRVQMAINLLGGGKFHIWIKNISQQPYNIQQGQFALVCRNEQRYSVYMSKDFGLRLEPGKTADGRLSFDTYCDPGEILFDHPLAGKIVRHIPVVDVPTVKTTEGNGEIK